MNILYLCDEYPPGSHGGIGTAVKVLAVEMARKGHNVVVAGLYDWGYGGEDYFEENGLRIYRFRMRLASPMFSRQSSLPVQIAYRLLKDSGIFEWDIKSSLQKYKVFLETLIEKYNIEIVEMPDFNGYMNFCKNPVFFPKLSVPIIVKAHGNMTYFTREAGKTESKAMWQMEHALLMQAYAVCAVSNYTANKTKAYFQYTREITTIYNGLTIPATESWTKIPNRVIFTGSLSHKKGIHQLLEAWNIVNEKMPIAELIILGKGRIDKLKKLLSGKSAATVFFKGHVSRGQLLQELGEAVVGVFPSFAESFGLAPLEAILCGDAVIYSSLHAGPELIENNVSGILVDPLDVNEIANKILFLLNNPDVCRQYAQNGMEMIKKKFDISIIADQNINFYYNVLRNSNTPYPA